ncbi:unnamed protein product [Heligmosomoides polygyrus]|uniref:DUF1534 domain-containing protein n=1 Tax=Heligmosomoides polygyrus TaxID=6339 RepID=A0A183FEP8_HELPZ|nr:unnamed protein product [Heligmosomoides polygyrus]
MKASQTFQQIEKKNSLVLPRSRDGLSWTTAERCQALRQNAAENFRCTRDTSRHAASPRLVHGAALTTVGRESHHDRSGMDEIAVPCDKALSFWPNTSASM